MPLWLLLNWKWLASAAAAAVLACILTALPYRATIARMERDKANDALAAANTALKQFTADADTIHGAAASFGGIRDELSAKLQTISRDFNSAIKAKPLPVDCKPDAVRLRALANAVAATNTAAGLQLGPAVPAHP